MMPSLRSNRAITFCLHIYINLSEFILKDKLNSANHRLTLAHYLSFQERPAGL